MFYDHILELDPGKESILVTGLDAPLLGEHCLYSDGALLGRTPGWPDLPDLAETLRAEGKIRTFGDGSVEAAGHRLFVEKIRPRRTLVICGAGHVGLSVLTLAHFLGFETYVAEARPALAERAEALGADHVLTGSFRECLASVPDSPENCYVIMTRGHRFDMECLRIILRRRRAYAGMMCSRKRALEARRLMEEEGLGLQLAGLSAPIGLKIGAETPEEIAVSVMAEIISVLGKEACSSIPEEVMAAVVRPGRKVLATIVSRRGSTPRRAGSRMVIGDDGQCTGTIGGGCFEAAVIRKARELLALQEGPVLFRADLTGQSCREGEGEGSACGGEMEVLLEPLP